MLMYKLYVCFLAIIIKIYFNHIFSVIIFFTGNII